MSLTTSRLIRLRSTTSSVCHRLGLYTPNTDTKYSDYLSIRKRIDSFEVAAWRQQSILQQTSPLLTPESFARAGFFYSGTADNVMCFWCGLGLNQWESTDDPMVEHVRFTPRCTWLLRASAATESKSIKHSNRLYRSSRHYDR